MQDMPIIELRVREFGERLKGMIALHHDEIEQYIADGVEEAMRNLGRKIIDQAAQEASKQIHAQVTAYFTYGQGAIAIRQAIETALQPIADMLRQIDPHHE